MGKFLSAVKRGPTKRPQRIMVYGMAGVGKTTFAASAPGAIVIPVEEGADLLDVPKFSKPHSWLELLGMIDELKTDSHEFKTVVLDTLDEAEKLCHAHTCATNHWDSMATPEFGKGYEAAFGNWRLFLKKLEELRDAKSMDIILLAHAEIKAFKAPESEAFDRWQPRLHKTASKATQEWCDHVFFAQFVTAVTKDRDRRVRGMSTGARLLRTCWNAAYDAKSRSSLPPSLPLAWEDFEAEMAKNAPASKEQLAAEFARILPLMPQNKRNAATTGFAKAGDDLAKLAMVVEAARGHVQINAVEESDEATA